jgi:hypothetical protein
MTDLPGPGRATSTPWSAGRAQFAGPDGPEYEVQLVWLSVGSLVGQSESASRPARQAG